MRIVGIQEWLHIASTQLLTVHAYHRKRGSPEMDCMQILPGFKRVMVHDFWSPYFQYLTHHAISNAYIIHELKGISENFGRKYQNEILLLIKDFSVPFSNNQAERDIRRIKLQQKMSGTFRSEDGSANFCRVRGYILTFQYLSA